MKKAYADILNETACVESDIYPAQTTGQQDIYGYYQGYASSPKNYSWGNWDSKWGTTTYNFDTIEKQMRRKKSINRALEKFKNDNHIIAKTYVSGDTDINRKAGIYSISVDNIPEWKSEMETLQNSLDVWKKIPSSKKVKDNSAFFGTLIKYFTKNSLPVLFKHTQLYVDGNLAEIDNICNTIRTILSYPVITDSDIDILLASIPPDILDEINNEIGHGGYTKDTPLTTINKQDKKLRITVPSDSFIKRPSFSKGKRINKSFIQKTDYRALKTKERIIYKKKKLLILLDASGSMRQGRYDTSAYDTSVNFIGSLMSLNIFDIEVYHTTDKQVTRATPAMLNWTTGKSGNQFIDTGGSEGFEKLTSRLGYLTRNEDYVLVITDMEVPLDAEENLKAFIGGKKHLILSFRNKGKFGCNVRIVTKYEDMADIVTTLL